MILYNSSLIYSLYFLLEMLNLYLTNCITVYLLVDLYLSIHHDLFESMNLSYI